MGKKQPNIHNKKKKKTIKKFVSSKKSKHSNIHSKRNKRCNLSFYSNSGYNSKKSSKKKFLENSSKRRRRKEEIIKNINITNYHNYINNNYYIDNNIIDFVANDNKKSKGPPEWMSTETEKIIDNNLRFSKELLEYVNYISPNHKSLSIRETTVQLLKQTIRRKRPEWRVHLFGSYKQGTSTVFSDLDFEIIIDKNSSRKRDIDELFFLMKILKHGDFSNNIRLIRARVPILKATCTATGISVDISVNRHNGYQAADLIKNIIAKYKILKPIIIILKILLKMNKLNEAHTGGMSSFLLFHLIFFFYLYYIKNKLYLVSLDNYELKDIKNTNKININKKYKKEYNNEIFSEESINSDDCDDSKSEKGYILTKAASITDDGSNTNEIDSDIIHNGESSSNSDSEDKSDHKTEIIDVEMGNRLKIQNMTNSSDEISKSYEENCEDKYSEKADNKKESSKLYGNVDIVDFLLKFLFFYGWKFDSENEGIKITGDGSFETYFKVERREMDCSDTISVESIQEPETDIGKSCYKYNDIKIIFLRKYKQIKNEIGNNSISILQVLNFPTV